MTTTQLPRSAAISAKPRKKRPWIFHLYMAPISLIWIAPMVFVVIVAFRSFADITQNGLGGLPHSFTWDGFATVFTSGLVNHALVNSAIVTVFTVFFSLLLSSWAAFALSRYEIPFRRAILLLMLAGNLLPAQILLIPVARITDSLGIPDTLFALILVQVAFGLGFYTFVLHGFMRSIPSEIFEAARVDGAGELRVYLTLVLPLTRPSSPRKAARRAWNSSLAAA